MKPRFFCVFYHLCFSLLISANKNAAVSSLMPNGNAIFMRERKRDNLL